MRSDTEGIDLFWRARPTGLGPETENENQASGIWGSINRGVCFLGKYNIRHVTGTSTLGALKGVLSSAWSCDLNTCPARFSKLACMGGVFYLLQKAQYRLGACGRMDAGELVCTC
jgi:hypothetical protein